MFHRQRAIVIALPAALLFGLSGCSLLVAPGPEPLTGTAACALGHTWNANLEDLAAQVLTNLQQSGVAATEATITGELKLDWTVEGHVALTNDYVVTVKAVPVADHTITVVETHAGTATGAAYINGEVAIPRKWDASDVTVAVVADDNGVPVDPAPFAIPETSFDDSVGLELTCNGGEMTTHPRGGKLTQKWTS
jgi:hypothetical protein